MSKNRYFRKNLDGSYSFVVLEPEVVLDRGFENAGWWRELELRPGVYRAKKQSWNGVAVSVPGIVVRDNFQSMFGGVRYGQYDETKNEGQEAHYTTSQYTYLIDAVEDGGEQ